MKNIVCCVPAFPKARAVFPAFEGFVRDPRLKCSLAQVLAGLVSIPQLPRTLSGNSFHMNGCAV